MRSGISRWVSLAALGAVAWCPEAWAQTAVLWSSATGNTLSTPGVWGNGAAIRTREQTYEGAAVLKVTTRNPEEGARFDVEPPVDPKPFLGENGRLRLRVRFRDAPIPVVQPPTGGDFPGFPGGGLGLPGFATPGAGTPGAGTPGAVPPGAANPGFGLPGLGAPVAPMQFRGNNQVMRGSIQLGHAQFSPLPPLGTLGNGFPVVPGAGATGNVAGQPAGNLAQPGGMMAPPVPVWTGPPPQQTALRRLLVTLLLDQGALAGYVDLDLEATAPDDNGWRLFSVPIGSLRASPGANGMLRRVLLTGDVEDSFYLEQMALMIETDTLSVSIRRPEDPPGARIAEITVRPGPITLVADIEAGTSDPIIEWNFDADNLGTLPPPALGPPPVVLQEGAAPVIAGPRIDARGPVARFEYPNEEQNYRVQVTLRDRVGKKAPVTASILVRTRG